LSSPRNIIFALEKMPTNPQIKEFLLEDTAKLSGMRRRLVKTQKKLKGEIERTHLLLNVF
jgi:hypothetical protein